MLTSVGRCTPESILPSKGVTKWQTGFCLFSTSSENIGIANRNQQILHFNISEQYACYIIGLTLHIPGSPNSIVEANLVPPQQLEAFEVLPFW